METIAYSPAHITGIFQICDQQTDALRKGSKGAGLSIDLGVYTKVKAEPSHKPNFQIFINGGITNYAPVSEFVLSRYQSMTDQNYAFIVEHKAEIPIGSGFGASGAGALSLSIALNDLLGMGFSKVEAAQIAHEAEVKCRTGLGTVIAETYGGVELRVKEGGPGIGKVSQIESNSHCVLVALHYGPQSTKRALSNSYLCRRINRVGSEMIDDLILHPSVENFLRNSRIFSETLGLMTERMRKVVEGMWSYGVDCGMAMFGEVVFTLTTPSQAEEVRKSFRRFSSDGDLLTAGIDFKGARTI